MKKREKNREENMGDLFCKKTIIFNKTKNITQIQRKINGR